MDSTGVGPSIRQQAEEEGTGLLPRMDSRSEMPRFKNLSDRDEKSLRSPGSLSVGSGNSAMDQEYNKFVLAGAKKCVQAYFDQVVDKSLVGTCLRRRSPVWKEKFLGLINLKWVHTKCGLLASLMVDIGKSVIDQEVISTETVESVTEAEESVKEAEEADEEESEAAYLLWTMIPKHLFDVTIDGVKHMGVTEDEVNRLTTELGDIASQARQAGKKRVCYQLRVAEQDKKPGEIMSFIEFALNTMPMEVEKANEMRKAMAIEAKAKAIAPKAMEAKKANAMRKAKAIAPKAMEAKAKAIAPKAMEAKKANAMSKAKAIAPKAMEAKKANAMSKAKAIAPKAIEAKAKAIAPKAMEAKANDEEAWKAEVSLTEAGKDEEAVAVGSCKSASEDYVMGTETLQQLLTAMPNKFDILDPDGDDEKDEMIDRGRSAIEEEHMPSGGKNPSYRGEVSLTVGSGKSAMDQAVTSLETEESGTEAVKEAQEGVVLSGMDSTGGKSPMRKQAKEGDLLAIAPKAMEAKAKDEEAWKAEVSVTEAGKSEEAVAAGSCRSAMEDDVMGKETSQQLLKGMPADADGNDEKDEMIHRGKSAIEEERMPSDGMNPSDRGEESVKLGSGKSAMDKKEVMGKEHDIGNSAAALPKKKTAAEKEMADEAKSFASHRKVWVSKHGKRCGLFSATTVLSSMQFTHYTPGLSPCSSSCCTPETLQIFSIKLTGLDGGLEFPLSVYGVVAVRDLVDRNRNILFIRDSSRRQELKQDDPFLHLIGPSRAILFAERVCFEIELSVVVGSQSKALISCARRYAGGYGDGLHTICFKNSFCTLEVSTQPVKQTVQATILSVKVVQDDGSWPLQYGGLVACSPRSGEIVITDGRLSRNIDPSSSPPIMLVHSKHGAVPKGYGGFVHLWRQVVSVQLEGMLDFDIKSYSKSGAIAGEASACFLPQVSNISEKKCLLGDAEVTITVAWSRVATDKMGVESENCARRCF